MYKTFWAVFLTIMMMVTPALGNSIEREPLPMEYEHYIPARSIEDAFTYAVGISCEMPLWRNIFEFAPPMKIGDLTVEELICVLVPVIS